jgi:hypothetical protein
VSVGDGGRLILLVNFLRLFVVDGAFRARAPWPPWRVELPAPPEPDLPAEDILPELDTCQLLDVPAILCRAHKVLRVALHGGGVRQADEVAIQVRENLAPAKSVRRRVVDVAGALALPQVGVDKIARLDIQPVLEDVEPAAEGLTGTERDFVLLAPNCRAQEGVALTRGELLRHLLEVR